MIDVETRFCAAGRDAPHRPWTPSTILGLAHFGQCAGARLPQRSAFVVIAILAGTLLGGCAGDSALTGALPTGFNAGSGLSMPNLALPKLAAPAPTAPIGTVTRIEPVGTPTEIYARIARGAVQCWFGPAGPLKSAYIYHAEADAPSRGGRAEITLHVREPSQPNPRGAKAYRVKIEPQGEVSVVEAENLKLPEPMALALNSEVGRWSKGEQGCTGATTAVGWSPQDGTGSQPVAGAATKAKNAKAVAVAQSTKSLIAKGKTASPQIKP